jgi:hypothetical protein
MKLTDYFCDLFIGILKGQIDSNLIDLSNLKKHIDSCKTCQAGSKKLTSMFLTKFNPTQLISLLTIGK